MRATGRAWLVVIALAVTGCSGADDGPAAPTTTVSSSAVSVPASSPSPSPEPSAADTQITYPQGLTDEERTAAENAVAGYLRFVEVYDEVVQNGGTDAVERHDDRRHRQRFDGHHSNREHLR